MTDLIGSVVVMAAAFVSVFVVIAALDVGVRARIATLVVVGGWFGLALHAGASGAVSLSPRPGEVPVIAMLLGAPIIVTAIALVVSRGFRSALLSVPIPVLAAVNVSRLLGVLFLVLEAQGRLSGPFPHSAGWGDILVGALAVPVAFASTRASSRSRLAVTLWNFVGAADLAIAVGLGITSADGSPLQLIHAGVGSEAMQHLPFSLIPTFLVPFFLITHIAIAGRLWLRHELPQVNNAGLGELAPKPLAH